MTADLNLDDSLTRLERDVRELIDCHFDEATLIAVSRIRTFLNADCCTLYMVKSDCSTIEPVAHQGIETAEEMAHSLPQGQKLIDMIAATMKPLNVLDVEDNPDPKTQDWINVSSIRALLGVPIVSNSISMGVLIVQRGFTRFTDEEEGVLMAFGMTLSSCITQSAIQGNLRVLTPENDAGPVERKYSGVSGAPGCAIGFGYVIYPSASLDKIPDQEISDPEIEFQKFLEAVRDVKDDNEVLYHTLDDLDRIERELFEAYIHILDDEMLANEVYQEIFETLNWAQGAIKKVFRRHIEKLTQIDNEYLAERADVFRDIGQQLITRLQNPMEEERSLPDQGFILVSEEVTASMIVQLIDDGNLQGIVSKAGSANAHTAILAKALGLPAVMGATEMPLYETSAQMVIVDGSDGEVFLNPGSSTCARYKQIVSEDRSFEEELLQLKNLPTETRDGHRIQLWVNIGLVDEIIESLDCGAEGIGLFRTEIPFAKNDQFPTETQQCSMYREHMIAFNPKPVTMRMLDIGGDKQLPYFPIKEENPFLGWRGSRIILDHPEIFLVQVRAMLKAHDGLECKLRIMLPMVTTVEEIEFAKNLIQQACQEVENEGIPVKKPDVGAMVEVPALIFQGRRIAQSVDFLAVGSNDLTQYLLAVSRSNPRVASLYQEFHPSVLLAMRSVVKDAHSEHTPIGICGEMAGTVEGAILLIGIGFDVLSMSAINIPRVKWVIRNLSRVGCRRILSQALKLQDAKSIIKFVHAQMMELGLERVVPHGRRRSKL